MLSRLAVRTCACVLVLSMPTFPTVLAHGASQAESGELAPIAVRRPLRGVVGEIARLGDADGVVMLREILVDLGHDPEDLAKFDRKWQRTLEKAKPPADRLRATTAKKLSRSIRGLEALLDTSDAEARTQLAALILRLDSDSDAAHESAGHVRRGSRWLSEEDAAREAGVAYLRELEQSARSLPVRIADSVPSTLPVARLLYGNGARHITAHGLHLHGPLEDVQLKRILRASLRALALSQGSRGLSLEIPTFDPPIVFVFTAEESEYQSALDEARANGGIDARMIEQQRAVKIRSFVDLRGWRTSRWRTESHYMALITWEAVKQLLGRSAQPCLVAGHINWLCLRSFGTATPSSVWQDRRTGDGQSTAKPSQRDEALWRSASSGIFGCRSWIRAQLDSGRKVTLARSIVDDLGKVSGEPLLVATIVNEYLQATGQLAGMLEATREKAGARKAGAEEVSRVAAFEAAIGMTLPEFDSVWTAWLTGGSGALDSVLQRVRGGSTHREDAAPDTTEARALEHLRAVRSRAFARLDIWFERVSLFAELSAGARAHARYLGAHPEQKNVWPDAHEEFTDADDFTPEGAWAGGHSVISFGGDPVTAIDSWLGTFYHRLPLLDPGLCGTGVGVYEDVVLLDTGSLRNQFWGETKVLWPPRDAKDVPLRFKPETPSPVPGEDQTRWGYPITVQAFWGQQAEPRTLRMSMVRSGESEAVPCHKITPHAPFFEKLAPVDAYGLIPKGPLASRTKYVVTVYCPEMDEATTWSFTTGD